MQDFWAVQRFSDLWSVICELAHIFHTNLPPKMISKKWNIRVYDGQSYKRYKDQEQEQVFWESLDSNQDWAVSFP